MLQLLGIGLLIIGILLICVEIYIPGFGLPGITGILCTISGIRLAANTPNQVLFLLFVTAVILIIMVIVSIRFLKSPNFKPPIRLDTEMRGRQSFSEAVSSDLKGRSGIALTDLRPSGKGVFDDTELQVLANGSFIAKGSKIQIMEINGNQVIVKEEK